MKTKAAREKPREKIREVREKASIFAKKRVEIAFDVMKTIEGSIRGDPTILLELDIPPNPSAEFEMKRRKAVKENRREFLDSFPIYSHFANKRIIE